MRAIVDPTDLARAMRDLAKVAPKRGVPILSHVLLEARAGRLRLVAYDLDELVIREIRARGVIAGDAAVPARLLRDLANELRKWGEPILLERETQRAFAWGEESESLLVMARPGNFVAHVVARSVDECPPAMRDFDLGDWGLMAPVAVPRRLAA